ncbi:rhodanese-like domain-containing protein [Leucothrix pacifica]|uniref:Rhodanese-like domain-containing protein n=1 Tax=Leucothrix pacifica TaxID=1247513 RepID=A0A317CPJ8_9GAMM|nr:rhodanese-like domain-containing protein [Leucothrix pacifica]PWR00002.1 rhodanese-like domain-containing protein [Leucothrix pacifica]
MQEYIEFARTNPLLVLGFFGVLALIIWTEWGRLNRKYQLAPVNTAVKMMNDDKTVVVDVREDREVADGMIKGAKHIPLSTLATRIGELDKYKSAPILVYCRSGNRSGSACSTLTKAGFENVNNLVGGITAWETASLPIAKR